MKIETLQAFTGGGAMPVSMPTLDRATCEGRQVDVWPPTWLDRRAARTDGVVPAFSDDATACWHGALDALATRVDEAISLVVNVPFCAMHCLCCERDIRAAQPTGVLDGYVDVLVTRIEQLRQRLGARRDLVQLHLGGGSANELSESQLARLVDAIQRAFRVTGDTETTVECDPRRIGWGQLQLLRGLGFRQVTFGLLDLDPSVQLAIGRSQSAALLDDVCELARASGMDVVNLDLMIGLPAQTEAGWRATLDRALRLGADRLTPRCYRHRPLLAPAQRAIDADDLPDEATCRRLLALTAESLGEAGYRWIGVDQFVLETDDLAIAQDDGRLRRSLLSFTATEPAALLGVGAGAVSEIDGHVFRNESRVAAWESQVRAGASGVADVRVACARARQRRAAVEQMLCRLEVSLALFEGDFADGRDRLARHAAEGLVAVGEDRIKVTPAGRLQLDRLCAALGDAPIPNVAGAPRWLV